jgi:nucleoside 2-deoxyribosyltransferase
MKKCPVCGLIAEVTDAGDGKKISCLRCGRFEVTGTVFGVLTPKSLSLDQIACFSGWLSENTGSVVDSELLKHVLAIRAPSVGTKATKFLLKLASLFPKPGTGITLVPLDFAGLLTPAREIDAPDKFKPETKTYLALLGAAWIEDSREFGFLTHDYLHKEEGFLINYTGALSVYKISPKGWSFIEELRRGNVESKIGFIAMWFDKRLDPVHLAIERAVRNAGYEPKRIDQVEHNNKIDDEIIAWLRRSRFVIADMTGNRGGVYFESGFALGLGLEVFWLCRHKRLHRVHFDNRQYNFITWSDSDLEELTRRLQTRIEARLGVAQRAH